MIPEIQRAMRDPVARERERGAALTERADRLRQRCHDVGRTLEIRLAKGFLYDVEVADFTGTAGDVLAADPDLARRIATADVRPMQPVAAPVAERLAAEPSLKAGLATLREKSLYDVLRRYDKGITPGVRESGSSTRRTGSIWTATAAAARMPSSRPSRPSAVSPGAPSRPSPSAASTTTRCGCTRWTS